MLRKLRLHLARNVVGYVALFVVRAFRQSAVPVPDREIVAHGFFAADALPNDTTAATRARIIEVLGGAPVSERW